MNAMELIELIHEHNAELAVEHQRLIVRGQGDPLPEELQVALREHKAELMIALGIPIDVTVASILDEIRPHLPKTLRELPDSKLLALVNWAIINAWNAGVRKLELDGRR